MKDLDRALLNSHAAWDRLMEAQERNDTAAYNQIRQECERIADNELYDREQIRYGNKNDNMRRG